jgi:anti-anti-sigma regulatory factor
MSTNTSTQAHIAYELIDDTDPSVVVIEFLSQEIAGPCQAHELAEQLESLIRPELPQSFVINFGKVRSLGSTAFGEIVSFAHKVGGVHICEIGDHLRIGAALIGLDECAEFATNRRAAINGARRNAIRGAEETVDYPIFVN